MDLAAAVTRVMAFAPGGSLTQVISTLERDLKDGDGATAVRLAAEKAVDEDLFEAAVEVRRNLGRLNDLIHASAILLVLPLILEDGEKIVVPPSLAAGNDPSRPYDLETDRRVAEFKLSKWTGADAMRKRHVFKDLAHLAAHDTDRDRCLYVVGQAPVHFLRSSTATVGWALDRHLKPRESFATQFGSLTMTVAEFTNGPGRIVEIVDLATLLPGLAESVTVEADG